MASRGLDTFMTNAAGAAMRVYTIGSELVPVIACDNTGGRASLVSPVGNYLAYPVHEISRAAHGLTAQALRAAAPPLRALLSLTQFDKVVYVNHWLLAGGPPLHLDEPALAALIDRMRRAYPGHVIVFPGIVPRLDPALSRALERLGGGFVRSRTVHLVDPSRPLGGRALKRVRRNRAVDRALRREAESRRISDPEVLLRHTSRLHALYSQLYLQRHPGHLNPRYEPAFFRLLLESRLFSASAWHRNGVIEAFNIHLRANGVIRWSVCGVDVATSTQRALLRLALDDDLAAAERDGSIVNWGAGNGRFKRLRGAEPHVEHDVVFARHLSTMRRAPWWILGRLRGQRPGASTRRPS